MRHVSLHDTIDTPSHTPAHTRLLERTPPYNRTKVDPRDSFVAFDSLCIGFGPYTPLSAYSTSGKWYILSAGMGLITSKPSASDSEGWRSKRFSILFRADSMGWDVTLLTWARTWYWFEHVIFNVGRCFSILLPRSPLHIPQMLWTKCCFAG